MIDIKKRKKKINDVIDEMTDDSERVIIKNYRKALSRIKLLIADVYEKYEQDGVLTYPEMAKYKRLEKLHEAINEEMRRLIDENDKITKKTSEEVFKETYYRTSHMIAVVAGVILLTPKLSKEKIRLSVENPISGLTITEILKRNRIFAIWLIKQAVTQSFIQKSTYRQMVRKLVKILEKEAAKSIRLIRTEAHRNRESASLEATKQAEKQGINFRVVWVSIIDNRTRDTHAEMDGVEAELTENGDRLFTLPDGVQTEAPGMTGIPDHDLNCRCTTIQYPDGGALEKAKSQKTYKEWMEENELE